ncbi:hypothetical protein RSal33209_2366 [Renibacterium salmoninarum ATCC 33209]|uniref:Uncharacterized protein n=1 Tax=Renibacterium salmoninarum (strain ATCC 33209 / DSM 20767 / JCM 11484 / NBRC 15589 / NCIMB 2235) TaxID=288705 RepID=A9WR84_RENSM|nr:hypothetical protein RSal33209_2366 [Renibacterium salmoninarum ATCC 33209]
MPKPIMLATTATPKITLGQSLLKPSDLPKAVAQTASKTPEIAKIIHAMIYLLTPSCRWPGTAHLVRAPLAL